MYIFIYIYLYIFIYYIFASVFAKRKIFHQCLLIPQSGKSNFIYFSAYLISFLQSGKHFIVAIYFHEMQKKLSNFLYFFIHISFHFH